MKKTKMNFDTLCGIINTIETNKAVVVRLLITV